MLMTVCALLFCSSFSHGGQFSSIRKRDKECKLLIASSAPRDHCYEAIQERDAETFCKMEEDCRELLEPYFVCAGNETRAEKEMMISELMQKCEGENWSGTVIAAAGVITTAILVALTAVLN